MGIQSFYMVNDNEIINNISGDIQNRRIGEEQLFNSFSYFIGKAIRKFALSQQEAFDAYADTILITINKICTGNFEGRSSLKTFIYQIFHNKCVDLIRKKTTKKNSVNKTLSVNDFASHLSDTAKSVIQQMMEKSEWHTLRVKLKELGENCRKLLLLWADGYSDKEIVAESEYKTPEVVKTSRLRCLDKLRQVYQQ